MYPEKFIKWVNGDDSEPIKDKFKKTKRFTKGHKRWMELPKMIEVNGSVSSSVNREKKLEENQLQDTMINPDPNADQDMVYWDLMPAATPDHELKKLAKANNTLAFIVEGSCFDNGKQ